MANNITIKDGNDVARVLHTIEDSVSAHYNQSIPTDVSGHTASIVSGAGQAATSGMGALVVAHHPSSPLPAGTNFLGKVSVGDTHFNVSVGGGTAHIGRVSVFNDATPMNVSINSTVPATQSGTWTVQPGNTANTTPWLVSVNGTAAVTQSGTWTVAIADNAPVSVRGGVLGAVSLGGGSAHIGRVSVFNDATPLLVSVNGTAAVTQSGTWTVGITDNAPVSVRGGSMTVLPGNTANTTPWLVSVNGTTTVSVANTLTVNITDNAPVSVRGGVLGAVSLGGGSAHIGRVSVFNDATPMNVSVNSTVPVTQSGTWTVAIADNAPVSVRGGVLSAVSLSGGSAIIGQVSIAGALQAQTANNVLIGAVSLAGTLNATGTTMTQTVAAAVTTEGYPMLGSDGTNARRLLTTTGGALVVHLSNAMVSSGQNSSNSNNMMPFGGTDGSDYRLQLMDITGAAHVTQVAFKISDNFTRPNDTVNYSAADLVANSTTASAVKALSFPIQKVSGKAVPFYIRKARMVCAPGFIGIATVAFRLHIFNATHVSCSVVNVDNGIYIAAPVSDYVGYIDFAGTADTKRTDKKLRLTAAGTSVEAFYNALPNTGSELFVIPRPTQTSISAWLECATAPTAAGTPANQNYWVELECFYA